MSAPVFTIGAGFTASGPLDTGATYVDLAGDLETLSVTRGRQTEDDQAQTGNGTLVLSDDSRKYDPNNAASAYYPNVQPMVPFYITALLGGTTYPVMRGWVDLQDAWVRDESEPGRALVTATLNDGFEILNNSRLITIPPSGALRTGLVSSSLGADFPQADTGTRINNVLAGYLGPGVPGARNFLGMDPSWPSAWLNLDTGYEQVQAVVQANDVDTAPLSMIRDAETTEPGFFFFARNGYATFHNRRHRIMATSSATFCDKANLSGARVLYESVTTRRTNVINDVRATRNGGTVQQVEDGPSVVKLLRRAKDYATQHLTDALALAFAQWTLSQKKDSHEVLESLTLQPGNDTAAWQQVLGRELGDRITVVRTPPGGGSAVTEDYFIEGVALTYGPGASASCTWRLSAAADQTTYWLAGVAGSSEAGITTKAGY